MFSTNVTLHLTLASYDIKTWVCPRTVFHREKLPSPYNFICITKVTCHLFAFIFVCMKRIMIYSDDLTANSVPLLADFCWRFLTFSSIKCYTALSFRSHSKVQQLTSWKWAYHHRSKRRWPCWPPVSWEQSVHNCWLGLHSEPQCYSWSRWCICLAEQLVLLGSWK